MIILDTDILSLIQRDNSPEGLKPTIAGLPIAKDILPSELNVP